MPHTKTPKPNPGPHEIALSKMAPAARKRYKARQLAEFPWPSEWDIDLGSLTVGEVRLKGDSLWVFLTSPDFPCDPDGYFFVNPPLKVPDGTWRDEERNGETVEVENTVEDVERAFIQIVSEAATYYATHPNVWGRTTLTVYSDASDGTVYSFHGTTYSTARTGTGLFLDDTAVVMEIGQLESGGFTLAESFISFDTSSIPDADTIDDATLSLYGNYDLNDGETSEARVFDWGAGLTTADWVAGETLGAETLVATFANSGWTVEAYNAFTDVALPANINKTGSTRLLLHTDRLRTGSAPAEDVLEIVGAYAADETGTTKDPKLVINYSEAVTVDAEIDSTAAAATTAVEASVEVQVSIDSSAAAATTAVEASVEVQAEIDSTAAAAEAAMVADVFSGATATIDSDAPAAETAMVVDVAVEGEIDSTAAAATTAVEASVEVQVSIDSTTAAATTSLSATEPGTMYGRAAGSSTATGVLSSEDLPEDVPNSILIPRSS